MWIIGFDDGGCFEGKRLKKLAEDVAEWACEAELDIPTVDYIFYSGNKAEREYPKAIDALNKRIDACYEETKAEYAASADYGKYLTGYYQSSRF